MIDPLVIHRRSRDKIETQLRLLRNPEIPVPEKAKSMFPDDPRGGMIRALEASLKYTKRAIEFYEAGGVK